MDIKLEQLNILMQAIREIVKNRNCPDWISKKLSLAVKAAKEYHSNPDEKQIAIKQYEIDSDIRPFGINELAISNIADDHCLYKIVECLEPINNINLYNIQILKGDKNNPQGLIVHNVPETMLVHVKK